MSKNIKKDVLLGATAIAAATVMGANAVHADTTPVTAANGEQQTNNDQGSLDQAKQKVTDAQNQLTAAKSNAIKAQDNETTAQGSYDQAQQQTTAAQKNLTTQQDALKSKSGASLEDIQNQEEKVANAQKKVNDLQNSIKEEQDKYAAIKQAEDKVKEQEEKVYDADMNAGVARQELSNIKDFPKVVESVADFQVPDGFTEAYSHYRSVNLSDDGYKLETEYTKKGLSANTTNFLPNLRDVKNKVKHGPNGEIELTAAQIKLLTTYAANIINNIRSTIYKQPNGSKYTSGYLSVSDNALRFGTDFLNKAYNETNIMGHNSAALRNLVKDTNLYVSENIGNTYLMNDADNINSIKRSICNSIINMMYKDRQQDGLQMLGFGGHTENILRPTAPNARQYLIVTVDNNRQIHFLFLGDNYTDNKLKENFAVNATIPTGRTTEPVKLDPEDQVKLNKLEKKVADAESVFAKEQKNLENAKKAVADTQKAYNECLKNMPVGNLDIAKAQLEDEQNNLAAMKKDSNLIHSVEKARQDLNDANKAQDAAKAKLADAKTANINAQNAVKQAEDVLKQAETHYNSLLAIAQEQAKQKEEKPADTTKQSETTKKDNGENTVTKPSEEKPADTTKQSETTKKDDADTPATKPSEEKTADTTKHSDAAKKDTTDTSVTKPSEEKPANPTKQSDTATKDDATSAEKSDQQPATDKVITNDDTEADAHQTTVKSADKVIAKNNAEVKVTPTAATTTPVAKTTAVAHQANVAAPKTATPAANKLPQTGNKNSAAVIVLGALAAMFGFSLAAKKREF